MKNELKVMERKNVEFGTDELLGIKLSDGNIYLGIKKVCSNIGLNENQARNEIKKAQKNLLFIKHNSILKLSVKFDTQDRDTILIKENDVNIWLAQISLTPKMKKENPKAIDKLLKYQDKCAKVLYKAFMGTKEKKKEFYNDMGLKGEVIELKQDIKDMTKELSETKEELGNLINNSVINSYQAQKLNKLARERVKILLGGKVGTARYKKYSRTYFKRLWTSVNDALEVGTYKDINPTKYEYAQKLINEWEFLG